MLRTAVNTLPHTYSVPTFFLAACILVHCCGLFTSCPSLGCIVPSTGFPACRQGEVFVQPEEHIWCQRLYVYLAKKKLLKFHDRAVFSGTTPTSVLSSVEMINGRAVARNSSSCHLYLSRGIQTIHLMMNVSWGYSRERDTLKSKRVQA